MARRREHAVALTGAAALCSTVVPVFLSRATRVEGAIGSVVMGSICPAMCCALQRADSTLVG